MKASEIRELTLKLADISKTAKDPVELNSLISIFQATTNLEIAAQLAELNEKLDLLTYKRPTSFTDARLSHALRIHSR